MERPKKLSTTVACVYCHAVIVDSDDTCEACQAIVAANIAAMRAQPIVRRSIDEPLRELTPRVYSARTLTGQVFRGRSEY